MTSSTAPDLTALRPELEAGLRALDLDVALATPLLDYVALLVRWNATYNLTAIRDPREMIAKHLLDSLAMHPFVDGIGAWPTSAPARACPAFRWRSPNRGCRCRWWRATARRCASCGSDPQARSDQRRRPSNRGSRPSMPPAGSMRSPRARSRPLPRFWNPAAISCDPVAYCSQ
jgi:hypothetical protein